VLVTVGVQQRKAPCARLGIPIFCCDSDEETCIFLLVSWLLSQSVVKARQRLGKLSQRSRYGDIFGPISGWTK